MGTGEDTCPTRVSIHAVIHRRPKPETANRPLSKLFSNDMVLQRELPVAIWGDAQPGEQVKVVFAGQEKGATADANGSWRVILEQGLSRIRFHNRTSWMEVNETSQKRLSRVAFFFGYELFNELDVPIGLIPRHNGGTPIQSWMSLADAEGISASSSMTDDAKPSTRTVAR